MQFAHVKPLRSGKAHNLDQANLRPWHLPTKSALQSKVQASTGLQNVASSQQVQKSRINV